MIFRIEGDIPDECAGYLPNPEYSYQLKALTLDAELYDIMQAAGAVPCSVVLSPPGDGEEYPTINFGS